MQIVKISLRTKQIMAVIAHRQSTAFPHTTDSLNELAISPSDVAGACSEILVFLERLEKAGSDLFMDRPK